MEALGIVAVSRIWCLFVLWLSLFLLLLLLVVPDGSLNQGNPELSVEVGMAHRSVAVDGIFVAQRVHITLAIEVVDR